MTPKLADLTPEQRRTLAAGALGWTQCVGGCQPKGDTVPRYWRSPDGREKRLCPNPDIDANDALKLVEYWKAQTEKYARIFDLHLRSVGGWEASFTVLGLSDSPHFLARDESPARAITSAFLLAKGLAQ